MKISTYSIILAAAVAATNALAQMNMGDMKSMDMGKKPAAASKQTHTAKATVTKSDSKAGTVTLAHEPIPSLNWPAMSMSFKVKDKGLWSKLADGKKVQVEFVQEGDDYVVTKVK